MMSPAVEWGNILEKKLSEMLKSANNGSDVKSKIESAWQEFLDESVKGKDGIEISPPYIPAKGETNIKLFSPLPVNGKTKSAEEVAKKFADAWKSYMSGIVWQIPPPSPPFSVINDVKTSPSGLIQSYSKMIPELVAEFKKVPKRGKEKQKYQNLAKIFYSATLATGVQISGIAIAGSPPPPITLPKVAIR